MISTRGPQCQGFWSGRNSQPRCRWKIFYARGAQNWLRPAAAPCSARRRHLLALQPFPALVGLAPHRDQRGLVPRPRPAVLTGTRVLSTPGQMRIIHFVLIGTGLADEIAASPSFGRDPHEVGHGAKGIRAGGPGSLAPRDPPPLCGVAVAPGASCSPGDAERRPAPGLCRKYAESIQHSWRLGFHQ